MGLKQFFLKNRCGYFILLVHPVTIAILKYWMF